MNTKNNFEEFPVFDASNLKIAIVIARQNSAVTERVVKQIWDTLYEYKVEEEKIRVEFVASSKEVGFMAHFLSRAQQYDLIIVLGVMLAENSPSFILDSESLSRALVDVSLVNDVPIANAYIFASKGKEALSMLYLPSETVAGSLELAKTIWLSKNVKGDKKGKAKKSKKLKPE